MVVQDQSTEQDRQGVYSLYQDHPRQYEVKEQEWIYGQKDTLLLYFCAIQETYRSPNTPCPCSNRDRCTNPNGSDKTRYEGSYIQWGDAVS